MFLRKAIFLSFLLVLSGLPSLAQVDTGAIVGTVVDGQQQRIPLARRFGCCKRQRRSRNERRRLPRMAASCRFRR